MTSEVLSIGNEVLSGRTLDTNFQFLARLLEEAGARVVGHQAVADTPGAIEAALRLALSRADLVVCTGGLGPTPDDLTVEAVAKALGLGLRRDEAVLESLRQRWALWARGPMPPNNERQALLPEGAEAWTNPVGSAPGVYLRHEGRHIVLLPGVPDEMAALARAFIVPLVRRLSGLTVEYALIRTVGIAESVLQQRLSDLEARLPGAGVAYLPGLGGVDVRIALPSAVDAAARTALTETARAVVAERAGDYVYALDDRTLEAVIGDLLKERGWRVAVAESCTGGLLGGRLTRTPGSSAYVEGGVIVYSNASKVALAGVPAGLIEEHGAVSEPVARALARGIARRLDAECGIGITGIAGPEGGSEAKPVGTVHVAACSPAGEFHRPLRLRGSRDQVRERAVTVALDLLRRLLAGLPEVSAGALGVPPAQGAGPEPASGVAAS